MPSAKEIAHALSGAKRISNGWMACCPAHDDKNPSLSLNDGDNGKVLVKCHAGCSQETVIKALRNRGLWPEKPAAPRLQTAKRIERTYDYRDENGTLLYQVVRLKQKGFRQRKPNGKGGWEYSVTNVRKVPYRLPELLDRHDETVFVVEGEKDVDALFDRGMLATCNAGGSGKWTLELSPHLQGRSVILIPDNDAAGRNHVRDVADKLSCYADSIQVFDPSIDNPALAEKSDISDWLANGGDAEQILARSIPFTEWDKRLGSDVDELSDHTIDAPVASPFVFGDPANIPPREFIYSKHYIRSFVSATGGVGGSGKSTIIIAEALSIASGKELLGEKVQERCPVWYVNLEDPKDELDRRIAATAMHHGLTPDDLEGRLFVNSGRSSSFVLAEDSSNGVKIVEPVKAALIQEIQEHEIGVLIIDPFVKVHRVSENANERIDAVLTVFAEIAEETRIAIELVPHLRKGNGTAGADEIRGASSFIGAVRAARIVKRMTDDEARKAGIKDPCRPFVRVDNAKSNMAPPAGKTIWRKLVGVDLGNSTDTRPSDWVAVAEEWCWPDLFDDVTVNVLKEVQHRVAAGKFKHNVQAPDWVGYLIADVLGLDLKDAMAQEKVKAILKRLIGNGALKTVKKRDKDRKLKPFVEVGEWAK